MAQQAIQFIRNAEDAAARTVQNADAQHADILAQAKADADAQHCARMNAAQQAADGIRRAAQQQADAIRAAQQQADAAARQALHAQADGRMEAAVRLVMQQITG